MSAKVKTLKWRSDIPYPRPHFADSDCKLCAGWGTVPLLHGVAETPCPKGCEFREARKPVKQRAQKVSLAEDMLDIIDGYGEASEVCDD